MYVRVPNSGGRFQQEPSPHMGTVVEAKPSAKSYGRIPGTVTFDKLLSDRDKTIYSILAHYERKGIVNCGLRKMASVLGISKNRIGKSIDVLVARGHIERMEGTGVDGLRSNYRLLSPVFGGTETTAQPAQPKARPKVSKCLHCHKPRVLAKTGWCKACAAEKTAERKMEGVVIRMVGGMLA